jgi:hypothetical protein
VRPSLRRGCDPRVALGNVVHEEALAALAQGGVRPQIMLRWGTDRRAAHTAGVLNAVGFASGWGTGALGNWRKGPITVAWVRPKRHVCSESTVIVIVWGRPQRGRGRGQGLIIMRELRRCGSLGWRSGAYNASSGCAPFAQACCPIVGRRAARASRVSASLMGAVCAGKRVTTSRPCYAWWCRKPHLVSALELKCGFVLHTPLRAFWGWHLT